MKRRVLSALLVLALPASALSAQNLLVNGGLETGSFAGWSIGGNAISSGVATDGVHIPSADAHFQRNYQNVRSGSYAANATVRCSFFFCPAEFFTMTQTVSVLAGANYSVGYWLGNDSRSAFGIQNSDGYSQIFVNGVGLMSGSRTISPGSSSLDFVNIGTTFNSGAATSVTVQFRLNGSGTARVGISVDDFYLNGPAAADPGVVPEPATIGLVSLGLIGLAGAARRRRPT